MCRVRQDTKNPLNIRTSDNRTELEPELVSTQYGTITIIILTRVRLTVTDGSTRWFYGTLTEKQRVKDRESYLQQNKNYNELVLLRLHRRLLRAGLRLNIFDLGNFYNFDSY